MRLGTRKLLDRSFSALGVITILLMAGALLVILVPIFSKGLGAVVFEATVEHRRLLYEQFERGDISKLEAELEEVAAARAPVYAYFADYEREIAESLSPAVAALEVIAAESERYQGRIARRLRKYAAVESYEDRADAVERAYNLVAYSDDREQFAAQLERIEALIESNAVRAEAFVATSAAVRELLGPFPDEQKPALLRKQYGATRWERAEIALRHILYSEEWDYSDQDSMGVMVEKPRAEIFVGTSLAPLFEYVERNARDMLRPRLSFYSGFFLDSPKDSNIFGGILPALLGTLYLTLGAMLFALPIGVVAAIFFTEYAGDSIAVRILRTCVSTLAGVPSIVFGLFGLAFFINAIHIPKSVLAGSLTLALLILPTIIRASEEAIRSVPQTYREAALSLGAGKWHTVVSVILPAALPGILTGSVISMGRAAGETAPIIFTAAVSVGKALGPLQAILQPSPALSWNIYNLCTEHEAVDEIRHVQFGMAATLILLVLLLNTLAIVMRARISKKLRG
jgi:phosphate transport system permease protein